MSVIGWPTAYVLDKTLRIIKVDTSKYAGKRLAPLRTTNELVIKWNERHSAGGMTNAHSLNADVKMAKRGHIIEKSFDPLFWKESHRITEKDILTLQSLEPGHQRMSLDQIIGESMEDLKPRLIKRIEWMRWQAILTGKVTVNENGVNTVAEYGVPPANITLTPTTAWTETATATPFSDIETIKLTNFKGTGYSLGEVWLNSMTLKMLCDCEDTYTKYKGSSVKEAFTTGTAITLLKILLPDITFVIYDGEYDDESGNVYNFLPDGYIVFWPKSGPGEIMDITSTPSVNGKGGARTPKPGMFAFSVDKTDEANPYYDIVVGMYGAPRIIRPDTYFVMKVD